MANRSFLLTRGRHHPYQNPYSPGHLLYYQLAFSLDVIAPIADLRVILLLDSDQPFFFLDNHQPVLCLCFERAMHKVKRVPDIPQRDEFEKFQGRLVVPQQGPDIDRNQQVDNPRFIVGLVHRLHRNLE